MATSIKNPMDSDEAEPMRAEVFDIAVSALSFHGSRHETPRIVQAARAVLVEGMRPGEAATKFDLVLVRVSEAVGKIRDKWAAICEERGLVTETFSLSPMVIELLRQIELETLQPLQADMASKRRKKNTASASGPAKGDSAKGMSHPETSTHETSTQETSTPETTRPLAQKAVDKKTRKQPKTTAAKTTAETKPKK